MRLRLASRLGCSCHADVMTVAGRVHLDVAVLHPQLALVIEPLDQPFAA